MKVGGKLKFKDNSKTKVISKKKQEQPEIQAIFNEHLKMKDRITNYEPFEGSGLIVSSDRGVTGENTKFQQQISKGDKIVIEHPVVGKTQQGIVMLVLGDNSLLLEGSFSQDITSFIGFTVIKIPKIEKGHDIAEEYQKKLQEVNKTKPIQKPVLNVRVKKGTWSYENKKVQINDATSKEDQLNIRQKLIKDKFCW